MTLITFHFLILQYWQYLSHILYQWPAIAEILQFKFLKYSRKIVFPRLHLISAKQRWITPCSKMYLLTELLCFSLITSMTQSSDTCQSNLTLPTLISATEPILHSFCTDQLTTNNLEATQGLIDKIFITTDTHIIQCVPKKRTFSIACKLYRYYAFI